MLVSVGIFIGNGRLSVSLSRLSEMCIIRNWFVIHSARFVRDLGRQSVCLYNTIVLNILLIIFMPFKVLSIIFLNTILILNLVCQNTDCCPLSVSFFNYSLSIFC